MLYEVITEDVLHLAALVHKELYRGADVEVLEPPGEAQAGRVRDLPRQGGQAVRRHRARHRAQGRERGRGDSYNFV